MTGPLLEQTDLAGTVAKDETHRFLDFIPLASRPGNTGLAGRAFCPAPGDTHYTIMEMLL